MNFSLLSTYFGREFCLAMWASTSFNDVASSRKWQYISSMELKIRWYLELSGKEWKRDGGKLDGLVILNYSNTHRIHVWYIYLHLVDLYGKCR